MASYTFSDTSDSVTFNVSGLTSGDLVRFYVRPEPATGVLLVGDGPNDTKTATSYYMNNVKFSVSLTPGNRYAVNVDINDVLIGVRYFTAKSEEVLPTRPNDWYWSGISPGSTISVSASNWNLFCSRINEFRKYKGLSDYEFSPAVSGEPMYALQANEAWIAIYGISGHGDMPGLVSSGTILTASFMLGLQDALNNIS